MAGRSQTVPWWLGGEGVKTTEIKTDWPFLYLKISKKGPSKILSTGRPVCEMPSLSFAGAWGPKMDSCVSEVDLKQTFQQFISSVLWIRNDFVRILLFRSFRILPFKPSHLYNWQIYKRTSKRQYCGTVPFFTVPVHTFEKLQFRFRLLTSSGSNSSSVPRQWKAVFKNFVGKNLAFFTF
jgi:hypothetical protein